MCWLQAYVLNAELPVHRAATFLLLAVRQRCSHLRAGHLCNQRLELPFKIVKIPGSEEAELVWFWFFVICTCFVMQMCDCAGSGFVVGFGKTPQLLFKDDLFVVIIPAWSRQRMFPKQIMLFNITAQFVSCAILVLYSSVSLFLFQTDLLIRFLQGLPLKT